METTNQPINKNEIITLILADMRNRKLIMGLEATGLATDDFNTNLSYLIFSKMGIDKQYHTIVFNWYEDTIFNLLDTDLDKFRTHQLFLAEGLYYALEEKKTQVHSTTVLKDAGKCAFFGWNWFKI